MACCATCENTFELGRCATCENNDTLGQVVRPARTVLSCAGCATCATMTNLGRVCDLPEHLWEMVRDANESLDNEQRQQVMAFVGRWAHLFARTDGKLGKTPLVEHRIDTGDAHPIKQRPRRQGWTKREAIDKEVDKMLEADVIEPCFPNSSSDKEGRYSQGVRGFSKSQ